MTGSSTEKVERHDSVFSPFDLVWVGPDVHVHHVSLTLTRKPDRHNETHQPSSSVVSVTFDPYASSITTQW